MKFNKAKQARAGEQLQQLGKGAPAPPLGSHMDQLSQEDEASSSSGSSPPMSPLGLPQLSSSSSSISSWGSSSSSQHSQQSLLLLDDDDSSCNSKEDRSTYNTKFARYHIETFRRNDRLRWNFDFDHSRPLDESHHRQHSHQTVARYQWEPAR